MDVFKLSRNWFDFSFENPEKINTNHSAVYFFCIEHCNRLGWKEKFGFPSQMAMEAVGIKNWRTYIKTFEDLNKWGFIKLIEKSKNQWSSNIIAIVENTKANTKALDKALQKHSQKQVQSKCKSIVSIDIQETINKKQETKDLFNIDKNIDINKCLQFDLSFIIPQNQIQEDLKAKYFDFIVYRKEIKEPMKLQKSVEMKYKQLLATSQNNYVEAIKLLNNAMANEWINFHIQK